MAHFLDFSQSLGLEGMKESMDSRSSRLKKQTLLGWSLHPSPVCNWHASLHCSNRRDTSVKNTKRALRRVVLSKRRGESWRAPADGHVSVLDAVDNGGAVALHGLQIHAHHSCQNIQRHVPHVVVLVRQKPARQPQGPAQALQNMLVA